MYIYVQSYISGPHRQILFIDFAYGSLFHALFKNIIIFFVIFLLLAYSLLRNYNGGVITGQVQLSSVELKLRHPGSNLLQEVFILQELW